MAVQLTLPSAVDHLCRDTTAIGPPVRVEYFRLYRCTGCGKVVKMERRFEAHSC